MPPEDEHADLTAYLLGELDPDARARFERHLESCEACRAEVAELGGVVELASDSSDLDVAAPPGLTESVMAAIEAEAAAEAEVEAGADADRPPVPASTPRAGAPRPRRVGIRWPRLGFALAAVAAVAVAFVIGRGLTGEEEPGPGDPDAPLELQASIDGPGGSADIEVRRLASGREIEFVSDELPVIPEGEFYELWFVAPDDDLPDDPNRISAGTFHPDAEGFTDVIMHAAVVPSLYPTVEVTRETDNAPESSGDVVLELDATDLIIEE